MTPRASLLLAVLLGPACRATAPDFSGWDGPRVTFDAGQVLGPVSPLVFGANHRWAAAGAGSADPLTGQAYDAFTRQVSAAGVTAIRYPGGTLAGTFRFERAIGPQAGRKLQVAGSAASPVPVDSAFGPDEFGSLLERTGASGVLMLGFGTASPAEAASFVAYMTLPPGSAPVDGVDWAARRAGNGHPAPYPIAYAELGNEPFGQGPDQRYWMGGEVVTVDPRCADTPLPCLYAFGGSTRFTRQPVVGESDWRPATSLGSGAPGQVVWARYPPVLAGSQAVEVGGVPWQQVASLATAAPDARVYLLDPATGRIAFGDGGHGAVPPDGDLITVSYTSGPHGGFVDYRAALQAVRPGLRLCSSFDDPAFLRLMGEAHRYDCHVVHPYVSAGAVTATGPDEAFGELMLLADASADLVGAARADIDRFAGARAASVELVLTEYGLLDGRLPAAFPHFLRSHGMGVLQALLLRRWIGLGVPLAMRHALVDYTFGGAPPDLAGFLVGDQALLQGPGPGTIPSPSALALELVRRHTGDRLLPSAVSGAPERLLASGRTLPALAAVATADAAHAYLVVINQDPSRAVDALVSPGRLRPAGAPTGQRLDAAQVSDENTPASPATVGIVELAPPPTDRHGSFRVLFPPHSVTALRIPRGRRRRAGGAHPTRRAPPGSRRPGHGW